MLAFAFLASIGAIGLSGCGGGSSAAPPMQVTATPGDSSVTLTFAQEPGVDYWVFFAPDPTITTSNFVNVPNSRVIREANSGILVTGLTNGTAYYFTINGRTDNGPGGSGSPTVSATPRPAGTNWTLVQPFTTANLNAVAFGLAGFVTVGAGGSIFNSTDGRTTWTARTSGTTNDLNAVTAIGGQYVAVGNGGVSVRGNDTITWTVANTATTQNLLAISQLGTTFVAVGEGGAIVTSPAGDAWTAQTSGTTATLRGVTYNGSSVYVAVGDNGTILTSPDSITWTARASGTTATLRAITFSALTFVAVGDGGVILTSSDGITWTAAADPATETLNGITAGSQFVAVGANGRIVTSSNAVNWTIATSNTTATLRGVAWSGFGYVAVGDAVATPGNPPAGTVLTSY